MSSDFPRSPKFLKGALVSFASHLLGPVPNVIVFQYNPYELRRTLANRSAAAQPSNAGAAREDAYRVQGPPVESMTMTVVLDATDQLAEPQRHPHAVQFGLHPALAALEMLLYPKSADLMRQELMTRTGSTQILSYDLPLALLVWGKSRVVPVRLTSFSVTEEAFDQQLNPIRATVSLGMNVLTFMELQKSSLGRDVYMVYLTQKETLARLNMVNSAEQVIGMLPF